MLNQVCVITIKVDQIDLAIEFYTKILGFAISKYYGENIISLKHSGIPVIIEKKRSDENTIGSNVVLAIQSNDIDSDFSMLKEKGVKLLFDGPKPCPPGRFFVIEDPFGNQLEVLQFLN